MRSRWILVGLGFLAAAEACASARAATDLRPARMSYVRIIVSDGVSAVIVDRRGHRTGWTGGHEVQEIRGCRYTSEDVGFGEEEYANTDTEADSGRSSESGAELGVSRGAADQPPDVHVFEFPVPLEPCDLIVQGGCELHVASRTVAVASIRIQAARVAGRDRCDAAVLDTLRAGVQHRWWLQWQGVGDGCDVKIVALPAKPPMKKRAR
jgi:hypothetical protein